MFDYFLLDPCFDNPCENGGTCTITGGTYKCTCVNGFTGSRCQIRKSCLSFKLICQITLIDFLDTFKHLMCSDFLHCVKLTIGHWVYVNSFLLQCIRCNLPQLRKTFNLSSIEKNFQNYSKLNFDRFQQV